MNAEECKEAEALFIIQDTNKALRLVAENEEQMKQIDKIDKQIEDKLKKPYVHN